MCPDISEETPCDSFLIISDHLTSATTKSLCNLVAYGRFNCIIIIIIIIITIMLFVIPALHNFYLVSKAQERMWAVPKRVIFMIMIMIIILWNLRFKRFTLPGK